MKITRSEFLTLHDRLSTAKVGSRNESTNYMRFLL